MRWAVASIAALVLLGCGARRDPEPGAASRPLPPAPPPSPSALVASAPPSAGPPPEPAPPPPLPLTLVEGGELRTHPSGARMTLFERSALGARFSPDLAHVLIVPGGRGARLRRLRDKRTLTLDAGYVTRGEFSADSRFLLLESEDGKLRVYETAGGQLSAEQRGQQARFLTPERVGFRIRCDAFTLELGAGKRPRRVGKQCGSLLHTNEGYDTWIVAEPSRFRLGVLQAYETAKRVHLPSGRSSVIVQGGGDAVFLEPRVSPTGDRLCFLQADFGLYCSDLGANAAPQRVWPSNVLRDPSFDASGRRLLFGVGRNEHSPRDVYVADFASGHVRKLVHATHEWWTFLPGGERIVGHGGDEKLTVYDLAKNLKIELGNAREEWEGLSLVPGDATRFLIGRERGGGRDLWQVQLPP